MRFGLPFITRHENQSRICGKGLRLRKKSESSQRTHVLCETTVSLCLSLLLKTFPDSPYFRFIFLQSKLYIEGRGHEVLSYKPVCEESRVDFPEDSYELSPLSDSVLVLPPSSRTYSPATENSASTSTATVYYFCLLLLSDVEELQFPLKIAQQTSFRKKNQSGYF